MSDVLVFDILRQQRDDHARLGITVSEFRLGHNAYALLRSEVLPKLTELGIADLDDKTFKFGGIPVYVDWTVDANFIRVVAA